jgi:hypothetical protein
MGETGFLPIRSVWANCDDSELAGALLPESDRTRFYPISDRGALLPPRRLRGPSTTWHRASRRAVQCGQLAGAGQ